MRAAAIGDYISHMLSWFTSSSILTSFSFFFFLACGAVDVAGAAGSGGSGGRCLSRGSSGGGE